MSQPRLSAARKRRLAESINAEALAKVQRIESGIPLSSSPPQSSPRSSSPLDGHAQVPAIVSTPPAGSDEPDPAIGNFEIEYDYGGGDEDNVEEEEEQEEEPEDRVESAEEDEQVDDEGEELPAEVDLGEMEEATVDLTLEALEELMAQELGEKLARVLRPRLSDLSHADMNSIKAFVFGHETNLSVDGHTLLSHLFPELSLDSLYKTRARVAYLADLRPLDFDACPSGCMAFTAVTEPPLTACTYCGEERFDAKGKRRGVYSFLDPAQVLKAQLENAERRDLLRYPHTRSDDPSRISDYLDCTHYSTLRKTLIPDTPSTAARVRYFANEFHVPLLLLTDGIGVWRKLSVWPILAVNLALPPTSRNRIDELLVLGLIHGSPKDLDSFLRPVVDAGITATSSGFLVAPTPSETVTARYSYILSGADARAKEKWTKSKGSNAIRGCLECTIVGVRDHERKGTTHYRALKLPNNLDLARFPKATDSDPLKLSKRTSKDYLLQGKAVELSADQDFASAAYGMNGVPILSRLSSIDVLLSFPNEYLHLLPLNNCKNLFKLLCGEFKDLDEGIERYQFFEGGRAECGRRVVAAQRTMPTLFGRAIPNPDTDLHLWTGSDFSSFFQFYAPWALRDQIPKAAYDHVLSLHRIMNRINLRSITRVQLTELRVWIAKFVQEWERLYYQYDKTRLSACPSTLHALLHLADNIEHSCPAWVSATWVLERYCEKAVSLIGSKRHPTINLMKKLLHIEQVHAVKFRYNLGPLLRRPHTSSPRELHDHGIYASFLPPLHDFTFASNNLLRNATASYLKIALGLDLDVPTISAELRGVECDSWGKLELDWGGVVEASEGCSQVEDRRDRSWIALTELQDKNFNNRDLPADLVIADSFASVQRFLWFKHRGEEHFLAAIRRCTHTEIAPGLMELDLGDRLQGTTVISIVSILTPVGRIPQRYDRGSGLAIPWKDVERPTFDLGDLMLGM